MLNYNAPTQTNSGTRSSIDATDSGQMNTFHWLRKAIIEARKEQFFTPLANVTQMPKHMGKTMKVYEYVPLLDDRNINDQGIDAAGVTIDGTKFVVDLKSAVKTFAVEADATNAAAAINAVESGVAVKSGASTPWTVTASKLVLAQGTDAATALVLTRWAGATRSQKSGNLYGSSKDIGLINGRIPVLGEEGGRVNRVGFTRLTREGSMHKMGFFTEFTQESLDFDSDDMLKDHLSRELMNGAVQLSEALLQRDLLTGAGVVLYGGAASSDAEITGETVAAVPGVSPEIPASVLTFDDMIRLDQILTDNRTPKQTTIITGSRYTDTKVVPACRVAFCGSELSPSLKKMTDSFGDKAFIAVQHYADAGTLLNGEIGSIDNFRLVQVPEMLHWAGAGAVAEDNPGYRTSSVGDDQRYNVYPLLVVGDDSFTTIGFQTDGANGKFNVKTKMPSENVNRDDPYGEVGFSSIKWYYGILIKRPERIAVAKCVAPE